MFDTLYKAVLTESVSEGFLVLLLWLKAFRMFSRLGLDIFFFGL